MENKENYRSVWYYKPADKWFDTRKQLKDYLGGTKEFNEALKNGDAVYFRYSNIVYLDKQDPD